MLFADVPCSDQGGAGGEKENPQLFLSLEHAYISK